MHEMSLAGSVLRIVEAAAGRENARRIRRVTLEIGRLAAIEPRALAFALELASRDTLAEGAHFELIEIGGSGRCGSCGHEAPMTTGYERCPQCGEGPLRIVRGDEMRVRDIEVD